MTDYIEINCVIAGEDCDIVAHVEYMPDTPRGTYMLTNGRKIIGSIVKGKDGKYKAVSETRLTQNDVDAIGEQIEKKR